MEAILAAREYFLYTRGLHIKSPEEWKKIFYTARECNLPPRIVQILLYDTNNTNKLTQKQQEAWNNYINICFNNKSN